MASLTLALYDPQFSYVPPLPYAENGNMGIDSGYRDILLYFSTCCPPYSNLDPSPREQDLVSDGFMSSAYGEEESDCLSRYLGSNMQLEYHEGEDPPYNGHENWPTRADFMHNWQERFFSIGNHVAHHNEQNGDSWETEEGIHQTEDQQRESFYKEEEAHIPCAYKPLSGYWSWLENQCEKHAQYYSSE